MKLVAVVAGLMSGLMFGGAAAAAPLTGWAWVGAPGDGSWSNGVVTMQLAAPGAARLAAEPVAVPAGTAMTLSLAYSGEGLKDYPPMDDHMARFTVEVEWRDAQGLDIDKARLARGLLPFRVVQDFFAPSPTPLPVAIPMRVPSGATQAAVCFTLEAAGKGQKAAVTVTEASLEEGTRPAAGLTAWPESATGSVTLTAAPAGADFGTNLVANGALEEGTELPAGWRLIGNDSRASVTWQDGGAYSGRRCFRLTDRGPYAASYGALRDTNLYVIGGEPGVADCNCHEEVSARFVSEPVPARPDEFLQTVSWQWHSRHEYIDRALINPVRIECLDANGRVIPDVHPTANCYIDTVVVRGQPGWVQVVGRAFRTRPGTAAVRVTVALTHAYLGILNGPLDRLPTAFGTVLVDNIAFYRTKAPAPAKEFSGFPTMMDPLPAYRTTVAKGGVPFVPTTPGHRPQSVRLKSQTPFPVGIALRDDRGKLLPGEAPFGIACENLLGDRRSISIAWQIVNSRETKVAEGTVVQNLEPYQETVAPVPCPRDLPFGPYWFRFEAKDAGEVVAKDESAFGLLHRNPNEYAERARFDYPFGTWCWPFGLYVRDRRPEQHDVGVYMEVGGVGKQGFTAGFSPDEVLSGGTNWQPVMDQRIAEIREVCAALRAHNVQLYGLLQGMSPGQQQQRPRIAKGVRYTINALKNDIQVWLYSDEIIGGQVTETNLDTNKNPDGTYLMNWGYTGTPRQFLDDYYFLYDVVKSVDTNLHVGLSTASHMNGSSARAVLATGGRDKLEMIGINMFASPHAIWPATVSVLEQAGIADRVYLYGNNYAGGVTVDPGASSHISAESAETVNMIKGWVRMLTAFPRLCFVPQWDTGFMESPGNMTYRRRVRPYFCAYAYMTSQLGAGQFVRSTEFSGGTLYVRQRSVRPGLVGVAWAAERDAVLELNVGVKKVTLVDLWGNRREVRTPRGVLVTRVTTEPVYIEGAKTLDLAPSIKIDLRQATTDSRATQIEAVLTNHRKEALTGQLELKPEGGLVLARHTFAVDKLAPGASQTFRVPVQPVFPGRDDRLSVRAIVTAGERAYEAVQSFRFVCALQAATPPQINGQLDEWVTEAEALVVDRESHLLRYGDQRPWLGPEDFSGQLWLKWDADNLYLAARVKDRGRTVRGKADDLWQGDGIEASLAVSDPAKSVHFALGATTNGAAATWYDGGNGEPRTGVQPAVKVAATHDNKAHSYEAAIPWRLLAAGKPALEPGHPLHLAFSFNDGDSGGTRMLWWAHPVGTINPAGYAPVILTSNTVSAPTAVSNLLAQGSADPSTGLPAGFSPVVAATAGGPCARITLDAGALCIDRLQPAGQVAVRTRLPVRGGQSYLVNCQVRVEEPKRCGERMDLNMGFVDAAGKGLPSARLLAISPHTDVAYGSLAMLRPYQTTSTGWNPLEVVIQAPADAAFVDMSFSTGDGLGKAWFGELGFYPLD